MSTFASVSKQIGKVKPETKSIAEELYNAAKAAGHDLWYIWGMGTSTEHKTGLALDLMVRNEKAGDFLRDYIWKHRKRLRLRHVIWEQHITSTVNQPGKRRKMADRGNPTANHYDHPHVWFFAGKYQPLPPPKPSTPAKPALLSVDGDLGPKTISLWQKVMGTKVDGKIDEDDSELIRKVQTRLNAVLGLRDKNRLKVDGDLGTMTTRRLQSYLKAPVTGQMGKETVKQLQRRLNTGKF